ncbi:MAG TPA: hypothetical protein V6D23_23025 [Candidatus Obscuribacterales bacterium]
MIRPPDDSFKRIPPPVTYQPAPAAGKPQGAEPASPAEPAPAPAPPPAAAEGPTDTKQVRDLGGQDPQPFDPQGLTFPGGRSVGAAETISLLNLDTGNGLPPLADMETALLYWHAACDAFNSGSLEMGKDLLAWAREFDPSAPDIPAKA